jgi:hypothetical protein
LPAVEAPEVAAVVGGAGLVEPEPPRGLAFDRRDEQEERGDPGGVKGVAEGRAGDYDETEEEPEGSGWSAEEEDEPSIVPSG